MITKEKIKDLFLKGAGLCQDSRYVKTGDIFVAIPSLKTQDHIQQALSKGAALIVASQEDAFLAPDKTIVVANPRWELSVLAAERYPGQPEVNVAVTGTSGKSSTVNFLRQIWKHLGIPAASIGTLGVELAPGLSQAFKPLDDDLKSSLTTPDALGMHRLLNALAERGISHCAFEASSHGLTQYRLHNVHLTAAGFTNLTQDHLDYHPTMEDYLEAKLRLFREVLPSGGVAVVNRSIPVFPHLEAATRQRGQRLITFSSREPADIQAKDIIFAEDHMVVTFDVFGKVYPKISLPLAGHFQIENVLMALGLAYGAGSTVEAIISALPSLTGVKGRMDFVGRTPQGAAIYVDYAHKPDAMRVALESLRKHTRHKLHVLFGCGGNRDQEKRGMMGEIASTLADVVYVTDDNPRYEDPTLIRQEIMQKCHGCVEIAGRGEAIAHAIHQLHEGDTLLIAGKGHEQGQIIADTTFAFEDRQEVENILQQL